MAGKAGGILNGGGGRMSGAPDTDEMVTRSPLSMVRMGARRGVEEAPMHRVGTGLNARDGCCFLHGNGPRFAAETIRIS